MVSHRLQSSVPVCLKAFYNLPSVITSVITSSVFVLPVLDSGLHRSP